MTRKLFRVMVDTHREYPETEKVYTVEAESHEQAARAAVNNYEAENKLFVAAKHIPFTAIKSVGDSTTVATKFAGDGTKDFVLDRPSLANKVLYNLSGNALLWVWGTIPGFVMGWILGASLG